MRLHTSLFLTSLCLPGVLSNFLGGVYPPPKDLTSSDSLVAAAWRNLTMSLEASLKVNTTGTPNLNDLTFSVGLFSIHDPNAEKLQYHHTSLENRNASNGTHKVDGDSIYRVASVSKLVTVFAGMVELSLEDWETPLSEILPEFANFLREKSDTLDPVYDTQWDKITPYALASHMGGIAQNSSPFYTQEWSVLELTGQVEPGRIQARWSLPDLDRSDPANWLPCNDEEGIMGICSPEDYATGASTNPPVALPWDFPLYSNNGFTLLGLAIENLTGKSLVDVYQDSLFDPLDMDSSYSEPPPTSELHRSVVASAYEAEFRFDNGVSRSSGGIYSTLNDLAKFSTGLLNSTLLPPYKTRRWMKPVSHTSNLRYSIGAPWEIYRYEDPKTGHVTDIYTKLGDSGSYGAMTVFLPDFDAGFNIIGASSQDSRSALIALAAQSLNDVYIPALIQQGAKELVREYKGTYVSTTKNLNSSITFAPSKNTTQGLVITSFISNGTDITLTDGLISEPYALQPIIKPSGSSNKIVFRPATAPLDPVLPRNPSNLFTRFYDGDQFAWLGNPTYGTQYVDEFVFDVGDDGQPEAVTLPAWRVKLEKK